MPVGYAAAGSVAGAAAQHLDEPDTGSSTPVSLRRRRDAEFNLCRPAGVKRRWAVCRRISSSSSSQHLPFGVFSRAALLPVGVMLAFKRAGLTMICSRSAGLYWRLSLADLLTAAGLWLMRSVGFAVRDAAPFARRIFWHSIAFEGFAKAAPGASLVRWCWCLSAGVQARSHHLGSSFSAGAAARLLITSGRSAAGEG